MPTAVHQSLCGLSLQVCSRLGLSLGFKVLDEGRYCLVWPRSGQQQRLLMAGGQACVVDVYGKGALLTAKEVSTAQAPTVHAIHPYRLCMQDCTPGQCEAALWCVAAPQLH